MAALHSTSRRADYRLIEAFRRYQFELAAINASRGLSDEDVEAWVTRADAILAEANSESVLTSEGALAIVELVKKNLGRNVDDPLLVVIDALKRYLESTRETPEGGLMGHIEKGRA